MRKITVSATHPRAPMCASLEESGSFFERLGEGDRELKAQQGLCAGQQNASFGQHLLDLLVQRAGLPFLFAVRHGALPVACVALSEQFEPIPEQECEPAKRDPGSDPAPQ